ncbi:MAG: SGNH/GDSL hydrolase family protein [Promethearchaeota archaeon]
MVEFTIGELHDKGVIHGLGWYNEKLYRFPPEMEDKLAPDLWDGACMPSGVRLCFRTRADVLILDGEYEVEGSHDQLSGAAHGFDVYEDGEFLQTIMGNPRAGSFIGFLDLDGAVEHDYVIYFPFYAKVQIACVVLEFKKGDDEPCLKSPSRTFALDEPVVFYGSSITHGAHAQRPGIIYPALIAKRLNVDFINLGFGGCGKGEPEVADLLADIDNPAMYVLDWGINIWADEEKALIYPRYGALVEKIKEKHPDVPILLVNLQTGGPKGPEGDHMRENIEEIRTEIKRVHALEVEGGNDRIYYADAMDIINPGNINELTTDRIHPNQAGAQQYANVLTPLIKEILGLE